MNLSLMGCRINWLSSLRMAQKEYGMFGDLMDYGWVLAPQQYKSKELLIAELGERVIAPAEAKVKELALKRQR
jgi:hypothetical protein